MCISRLVAGCAWLSLCGLTPLTAADLAKIERSIAKEPSYQTKSPKYCLLAFGPDAKTRVWLVLDGDTLYVDRNGNGDLTEPGNSTKVELRDRDPASFPSVPILANTSASPEKVEVYVFGWFRYLREKDASALEPSLSVTWKGRWYGAWGDETSRLVWGDSPKQAPILHVGGALRMGFEVRAASALRRKGDGYEVNVGVGTSGLGQGAFVHLKYWKTIPEEAQPTATLEFPNKTPGGPPVRVQARLKYRC